MHCVREILDDSGAVHVDFIRHSPGVTRVLTARDVPIIGQLADASFAQPRSRSLHDADPERGLTHLSHRVYQGR